MWSSEYDKSCKIIEKDLLQNRFAVEYAGAKSWT
jgi:hypothetical protein